MFNNGDIIHPLKMDHGLYSKPFLVIISGAGLRDGGVPLFFPIRSFGNIVLLGISFFNRKRKIHYFMWKKA